MIAIIDENRNFICMSCCCANSNLNHSIPTTLPNPNNPITIVDHHLPCITHNLYDVTFHSHYIQTLLTSDPSFVHSWLSHTRRLYPDHRHLTVGLDVEWRPNPSTSRRRNPVATIQLCIAHRCLIFQVLHAPSVPPSLAAFLADASNTFVGVGIEADAEKLLEDYELRVVNFVDLRDVAAGKMEERELKNAGLKTLSSRVLGLEVEKPREVSTSRWDNRWLSDEQVQYACVDAFVSYKIGMRLLGFNCGY
ncbi:hypothetical protein RIF29_30383 [Crotalaria pallida]|uniref:3'-5' exonuclease domain-containing protein n=1 Tax=Crotalaria pallida TaxID=3830 RepID=A0AAN9EIG2_CROPI